MKSTPLVLIFFLVCGGAFPPHLMADATPTPACDLTHTFTNDLPEMRKRHFIRVLVTHSKTNFFLMKGMPHGFEYDLFKQYEKWLNKGLSRRKIKTQMIFIPVPFDQLLSSLLNGHGDIAAAGLTVTPDRQKQAIFTESYLPRVDEIVVSYKGSKGVQNLNDLAGRSVSVVRASSYVRSLQRLNAQFRAKGLQPITIVEVSENLEAEDILEMVNAGALQLTVVDRHVAELWSGVLNKLVLHKTLKVNSGGKIAWAVRPNNPKLRESLNHFIKGNKKGTLIGNILFKRYYKNRKWIKNPLEDREREKLSTFLDLFKKYGNQYGFDWLAIAAQAYQESAFDHKAKSSRGAIGVMQVLPSTAADRAVNIPNIESVENNIHAGVKYLAFLRDRYFSSPKISESDRIDFSFAAYNAGAGNIQKMRRRAKKMGLNPNQWFYNVELTALKHIGQEPVRYVSNIHKYYVAYKFISASLGEKGKNLGID